MLTKVTQSHESGVRFLVNFFLITGKAYGKHADIFRSYVVVQGRNKVSILIYRWHDVNGEFKNKLRIDIMVFILNFMICCTSIDDLFFNTNINSIM